MSAVSGIANDKLHLYGLQFHPEVTSDSFSIARRKLQSSCQTAAGLDPFLLHWIVQVDMTENGAKIMKNFLLSVANVTPNYTMSNREHQCLSYIKETVKNRKVLVSPLCLRILRVMAPALTFRHSYNILNPICCMSSPNHNHFVHLEQMMLSGGVDSTVCAALLSRALKPEQVMALHIDNGFMRKGESQQVLDSLTSLGLKVKGETV